MLKWNPTGLTVVPQECDIEIIADSDQPQCVSHKVAQEPVGIDDHHIWNTQAQQHPSSVLRSEIFFSPHLVLLLKPQ